MAKKTEIEIVITESGQVKLHVKGMAGQACLLETAQLEKALGRPGPRALTSEYYQSSATTQVQKKQT